MSEAESKPPASPVPAAQGIPLKMVIIIVVGTLVLGLGGAFALLKLTSGGQGGDDHKTEPTVAKAAGQGETEAKRKAWLHVRSRTGESGFIATHQLDASLVETFQP